MSAAANLPPSTPSLPVCVFVLTVRDPQGDVTHLIHFALSIYFIISLLLFAVNQLQFLGLVVGGIPIKNKRYKIREYVSRVPNYFCTLFYTFYYCGRKVSIGSLWFQRLSPF